MKTKEKPTMMEVAKKNEATIAYVRKVLYAIPIMRNYDFFDYEKFVFSFNKLIKDACKKYKTKEANVRKIAGWDSKTDIINEINVK